jgi:hypothetical protein
MAELVSVSQCQHTKKPGKPRFRNPEGIIIYSFIYLLRRKSLRSSLAVSSLRRALIYVSTLTTPSLFTALLLPTKSCHPSSQALRPPALLLNISHNDPSNPRTTRELTIPWQRLATSPSAPVLKPPSYRVTVRGGGKS